MSSTLYYHKYFFGCLILLILVGTVSYGQKDKSGLLVVKKLPFTEPKDQSNTGTCWSFATTSLIESQAMSSGYGKFDLSEMFTVRNIYIEKAKNYILRDGKAQFGAGGLGHDVIHAFTTYGAMPESVFSGLMLNQRRHNHVEMDEKLKLYLDSVLRSQPVRPEWVQGFENILNDYLGKPPATFQYGEKQYTPLSFASEVLHFSADDYVNLTSFTHHPFYKSFILEVADNASNGTYYNVPLDVLIDITDKAITSGYSVMWDGDVSNNGFQDDKGYAMTLKKASTITDPDDEEVLFDQQVRQALYESLVTQDDHLMHIVGVEKSPKGKRFFLVKNSYGAQGPFQGLIHLSETYFALNTISLVLPKAALNPAIKAGLKIN